MNEAHDTGVNGGPLAASAAAALGALAWFHRHLYPPLFSEFQQRLRKHADLLSDCVQGAGGPCPGDRSPLLVSAGLALEALNLILETGEEDIRSFLGRVLRSYRKACRAEESLFSARHEFPEADRYFREDGVEEPACEGEVIHEGASGDPYERDALSVYAPDAGDAPLPLIVALHGGNGHGRDFLWTWVREARSRGYLVAAPSSCGPTWNVLDPDRDRGAIERAMEFVSRRWRVDHARILLTGVSDGGTFALGSILRKGAPYAAAAVAACTLPPADYREAAGRRVLWKQGSLDWMFPAERAEREARLMEGFGAHMDFRLIGDLSHSWPRDLNGAILDWFMNE